MDLPDVLSLSALRWLHRNEAFLIRRLLVSFKIDSKRTWSGFWSIEVVLTMMIWTFTSRRMLRFTAVSDLEDLWKSGSSKRCSSTCRRFIRNWMWEIFREAYRVSNLISECHHDQGIRAGRLRPRIVLLLCHRCSRRINIRSVCLQGFDGLGSEENDDLLYLVRGKLWRHSENSADGSDGRSRPLHRES